MANEAIEKDTPLAEVRQEPYTLPQGFKWDTLSLDNPQTVYKFKFYFPNSLKKNSMYSFYSFKSCINF